ncbi:hypothetical protein PsAD37_03230 [Pseudovibrio sp. Ad37]|nr:hypothetical protein PsAD37_03230 [Pseudovibrio sp. Ad37]
MDVVGGDHLGELGGFDLEAFGDGCVEAAGDGGEDAGGGEWGVAQDAFCQSEGFRQQVIVRDDLVDEAKLTGSVRTERVSGEQQFQRALATGETGQALGAAESGRNANVDLRFGKDGTV